MGFDAIGDAFDAMFLFVMAAFTGVVTSTLTLIVLAAMGQVPAIVLAWWAGGFFLGSFIIPVFVAGFSALFRWW